MQSMDKIVSYVNTICDQMRFKKAKEFVFEEMKNHMIDQRDFYIKQGLEEEEATIKAISDTGDPVAIGEQFDHVHRPKPQWTMILSIGILLLVGILIRGFFAYNPDRPELVTTNLVAALIGVVVMFGTYFFDFSIIEKCSKVIYFLVMLICVLAMANGPSYNGMVYISFGFRFISISLVEFALIFPVIYTTILYKMRNKGYLGIILCEFAFLLPAMVILYIPSFSAFIFFTICFFLITGTAIYKNWFGVKRRYSFILISFPAVIVAVIEYIRLGSYGLERLLAILRPELYEDKGYMVIMKKSLLSGAKFWGSGVIPEQYLGNSFPIPGVETDALLTYLICHYGWVFFVFIVLILLIPVRKGFSLCFKQKSYLGFFVSLAVMLTFTMQIAGYFVYNLGIINILPISLPLISYGNVALIINMGLMGLMLSVFRTGDVVLDKKVNGIPNKIVHYTDGTLTIRFKG